MQIGSVQLTDLLMRMYDNSSEAIFFCDGNGKVVSMNHSAEKILSPEVLNQMVMGNKDAICMTCKGYTNDKELRTCESCYLVSPQDDFSSFQVYLDTEGKGIVPYAASFQTIDPVNQISVLMLRDLTKQYKTQEALNHQTIVKNVIKAQEDERKRISRDLHDGVAQEMLSTLVDLRVLKYMDINAEVLKKVEQTEGSLMRLLDDIRNLSVELRPATLDDLGLEAAFRTHFKWMEKNYGFVIQFTGELNNKRYDGEIETVVYRICQEAVFNALKYASVDEVSVRLYEKDGNLELFVLDNGVGFDLNAINPKGTGLGLYGMRERADLATGQLTIRTDIGKGTVISLVIPLPVDVHKEDAP